MTINTADEFMDIVATDEALQKRFRSATTEAQVMDILKDEGIMCTPDEIRSAFLERYSSELSEEQLAVFAAGVSKAAIGAAVGIGAGMAIGVAVAVGGAAAAAAG